MANSSANISAHVRKRHDTTVRALKANLPAVPKAVRRRRAPEGHTLELIENLKIIRVDGQPGLWMPMDRVFDG